MFRGEAPGCHANQPRSGMAANRASKVLIYSTFHSSLRLLDLSFDVV
jgi:hypothetical protein